MMDKENQYCVYCQELPEDTEDHVPGLQFFPDPKPSPSDLVAVPACLGCNKKFQPFENYMRSLLMFSDAGVTGPGKKLWEQKLNRTYVKDAGLRNLIADSLRSVELKTPMGLYAGNGFAIETDWNRVQVFVDKLVKGLYFFEYGDPFPLSAEIRLAPKHYQPQTELSDCLPLTRNGQKRWPSIFEYRLNRVDSAPEASLWLFLLYGCIEWVVFTGKPKVA